MPNAKHAVNILLTEDEYSRLVCRATEVTLGERRRVSVAELVRRLALQKAFGF